MIVAIHQPNFLPWWGYFYKVSQCDIFVFLDDVPFSKGSYFNRVKIRNTSNGDSVWLTVPVKTSGQLGQNICDVKISSSDWQEKISNKLKSLYSKSLFFDTYREIICDQIKEFPSLLLSDLNKLLIKKIGQLLGFCPKFVSSSDLSNNYGVATERLISICKHFGAKTYVSGMGSKNYINEQSFRDSDIDIKYVDFRKKDYHDISLSICDGLFMFGLDTYCTR